MIDIKIIPESDFILNTNILFRLDHSRVFAKLSVDGNTFSIGWRSDLIQPEIKYITPTVFSVGVDQKFIIVDNASTGVLLEMNLNTNFYQTSQVGSKILIISELEVAIINSLSWEIDKFKQLPSYFKSIVSNEDKIRVECLDGEIITL